MEAVIFIHVISMIASMILMSGALTLGFFGKSVSVNVASLAMYATIIGFIAGLGLLIDAPFTPQCAGLTAYLIGVVILYRVGYGFGVVEKARFVRSRS